MNIKKIIFLMILHTSLISCMEEPENYSPSLKQPPTYSFLFNRLDVTTNNAFLQSFLNQKLSIKKDIEGFCFTFPNLENTQTIQMRAVYGCTLIHDLIRMAAIKTDPDCCATYSLTKIPNRSNSLYDLNIMLILFSRFFDFYSLQLPTNEHYTQLSLKHRKILEAFAITNLEKFDKTHKKAIEDAYNMKPVLENLTLEAVIKRYIP